MKYRLLFLLLITASFKGWSQDFQVQRLFVKESSGVVVYSLKITNTSSDSIIALHAQEAQFPPFINQYKFDETRNNMQKMILHFGKTSDELNPEKYRATKSLGPNESFSLYFSIPTGFDNDNKELELWYSFLDKKYLDEFKKAEASNATDAIRKCKTLKEKHGRVCHRFIVF